MPQSSIFPDPMKPLHPDTDAYTSEADLGRRANAISFEQIPEDQLPWPEVREALIERALAGHDCYAYEHRSLTYEVMHKEPQGVWVIWDRIDDDPGADARFTPHEWAIQHGFIAPERTFLEITMGCLYCGGTGRRWFGLRACSHCDGTGRRTTIRPVIENEQGGVTILPPVSKEARNG